MLFDRKTFPPRLHSQQLAAALPPRNHSPRFSKESSSDPEEEENEEEEEENSLAPGQHQLLLVPKVWPQSQRVPAMLKPSGAPLETAPRPQPCQSRDPNPA